MKKIIVFFLAVLLSFSGYAFDFLAGGLKVTIPSSVTHIGLSAFGECDFLKKVDCKGTEQRHPHLIIRK